MQHGGMYVAYIRFHGIPLQGNEMNLKPIMDDIFSF